MDFFEPLVNVLTVLTVLSVAAERVTNIIKLRRHAQWKATNDRQRELCITWANLVVGIGLALAMKADLFALLAHSDAPWSTLGWTHWDGHHWVASEALASRAGLAQALLGCAVTGVSLGFGSRFWHDTLGAVLELRNMVRRRSAAGAVSLGNSVAPP